MHGVTALQALSIPKRFAKRVLINQKSAPQHSFPSTMFATRSSCQQQNGRLHTAQRSFTASALPPARCMRTRAWSNDQSGNRNSQDLGQLLAAAAVTLAALTGGVTPAHAEATAPSSTGVDVPTVYFGNGCFWGRQKDFIDTEKSLGRAQPSDMTALVGYAGGTAAGPGGKVCYYYSDPRTIYERLGHAEVTQVALSDDPGAAEREFQKFAETYFSQFRPTRFGMSRLDPQDAGPGYRNVVGLPGGTNSPFFPLLQAANKNGMDLRPGLGNAYEGGAPREGDELNVVWVYDSSALPFYRAERYHQFHNGIGKAFGANYTRDLKNAMAEVGKIDGTGCPELPF